MQLDALIFDVDGTLVDSETIGADVLVEVAHRFGARLDLQTALHELRGLKMAECVAKIEQLSGLQLSAEFVPEVRRRTAEEFHKRLRPIAGAHALLSSLRIPFCVASNGPRAKIELSLSLTGLLPLVADRIYSAYEVGSWKPEPGLFLHAAAALGVEAQRCGVVEDSVAGIRAGLDAGMQVFAFGDVPQLVPQGSELRHARTLPELGLLLGSACHSRTAS